MFTLPLLVIMGILILTGSQTEVTAFEKIFD